MILTAHQPVYLPWLGLFHKIAMSDVFVSFNQVQYLPKDWNNRNKIKTASGAIWLTVPVHSHGHREISIDEIEIDNTQNWQDKHWKSICMNYRKAPYFNKYSREIKAFYSVKWKYLSMLNETMLLTFLRLLGIKVSVKSAVDYHFKGKGSDLVLDMCKQLKATTYVFGSQGKNYANIKSFADNGINVIFQDYKHPKYRQLYGDFIPNLSIIDLLFNEGENSLKILKNET